MAIVDVSPVISSGLKRRIARSQGGLWLSEHAVDRFVERVAPGLTRSQARGRLLWLAREGHIQPTRDRLPDGCRLYTSPDEPDARFVVREDDNGLREIVTVLRAGDDAEPEIDGVDPEELRIAMAEWRGRRR